MNKLEKEFKQFCDKLFFEQQKYNIALGFSGGIDSSALLVLLANYQKYTNFNSQNKVNLTAVFFLHGDNPLMVNESETKKHCEKIARELKINLVVEPLKLLKDNQSWESAGHRARQNYYKNSEYDYFFLGHHLDDQCETIMTQLMRGAGRSSSGILPIQNKAVRPLLSYKKTELKQYLIINNINWLEDPTNLDNNFTRNFWRNKALPKIEEYYPDYRKRLKTASDKMIRRDNISRDMAIVDGMDNLLSGKEITITTLSNNRIINLIEQISLETKVPYSEKHTVSLIEKMQSTQFKEVIFEGLKLKILKNNGESILHNVGYSISEKMRRKNV